MRFGTWNVWSLYRSGSLTTLARELGRYKLVLMSVQEVRWDNGGIVRAGDYIFSKKKKENHQLGTGIFVQHRIVSAVKIVEFFSDRKSYIDLRGRWSNVIMFNAHAASGEKSDDSKDSFYEKLEQVFDHFPKCRMKFLWGDFNEKMGREDIFKCIIGNESPNQISKGNSARIINFVTSENVVVKTTIFPHLKHSQIHLDLS